MKDIINTIINSIKSAISKTLNSIKTVWNTTWNGLKNTVSNVFNGIWSIIKKIINWILGGIEKMANGIVKGMNNVIRGLNNLRFSIPDWIPNVGGKSFGININTMNTVSLPRLAKGNVAYSETVAVFGEYTGASSNPEITTPQNIMRETFENVLANHEWNNNGQTIDLSVYVGNEKLGKILLNDLRDMRRQTGQGIEALVGG